MDTSNLMKHKKNSASKQLLDNKTKTKSKPKKSD